MAIAVPERPITMTAVMSGPSSRTTIETRSVPIRSSRRPVSTRTDWMIVTAPIKAAMPAIRGKACRPVKRNWLSAILPIRRLGSRRMRAVVQRKRP